MKVIWYQGEFIEADGREISHQNRGFRFGDGFFETMRIIDGRVCFFDAHFNRIVKTAAAFKMTVPAGFTREYLNDLLKELFERNGIRQGGRARITVARAGDGFYLPESSDFEIVAECIPLDLNHYTLNQNGYSVDIYPDLRKQVNAFSPFKTLNCHVYVMASIYAKEKGLGDCLIQNDKFGIIESTNSNLFIVSNGVLYTPALEDGCIGGIMRMQLINLALDNKMKVYECSLNPQNLLTADEIFLSNAVKGIQWVGSYRTKRYFYETAKKMTQILNVSLRETV
jgi:branched-chain amino acid aminotransferase